MNGYEEEGMAAPEPEAPPTSYSGKRLRPAEWKIMKQRLETAQKYAEKRFWPLYSRCNDLYKGRHWPGQQQLSEDHRVVVNSILPNVETKVSTLAFSPPGFSVRPENKASAPRADLSRDALSYEFRKAKVMREAKRCLKDKELYSVGVMMTGWCFETDELYLHDERRAVEGEEADPQVMLEAIAEGKDPAEAVIPKAKVRKDQFFCKRINPKSWLIDPEASWVLDDARYCGFTEIVPLDEVKKDPRYKNVKKLKGSTKNLADYATDQEKKEESNPEVEQAADAKRVCLKHYYEKKRRVHVVFCDEHDDPLLTEDWAHQWDSYPFAVLTGLHTEDEFYGIPGPILIEPMQREINETRSQMHTHRRRWNRKLQVAKGVLDAQGKKQIRSGVDGTVVEHNGAVGAEVVIPIRDAPLQPEVYECAKTAERDMAKVSGLDAYESGQVPTKRLTTTEVEAIQGSGAARMKADAQAFEEFLAEIARHCLNWLMQFSVKTRSLPIYDDDQNVVDWRDFTADDIRGEYEIEVDTGSTQIKNKEAMVKDTGFLLQSLMPFVQMGAVNPTPLLEQLLRQFEWVRDVNAILQPPPPPPGMEGAGPDQIGPPMDGGEQLPPELMAQLQGGA